MRKFPLWDGTLWELGNWPSPLQGPPGPCRCWRCSLCCKRPSPPWERSLSQAAQWGTGAPERGGCGREDGRRSERTAGSQASWSRFHPLHKIVPINSKASMQLREPLGSSFTPCCSHYTGLCSDSRRLRALRKMRLLGTNGFRFSDPPEFSLQLPAECEHNAWHPEDTQEMLNEACKPPKRFSQ